MQPVLSDLLDDNPGPLRLYTDISMGTRFEFNLHDVFIVSFHKWILLLHLGLANLTAFVRLRLGEFRSVVRPHGNGMFCLVVLLCTCPAV